MADTFSPQSTVRRAGRPARGEEVSANLARMADSFSPQSPARSQLGPGVKQARQAALASGGGLWRPLAPQLSWGLSFLPLSWLSRAPMTHEWAQPPLAASGASAVLGPQPHDGIWVAPVPWPEGSWVRHRPTGHWGYVFRSERNMCYVHFPVHIALVPEWLRMAAIRLDLSRTT